MPSDKVKVLIAMGTRPEIIKQAPVVWAARAHASVETIVCHSGQHSDLAEPMLSYFDVKPDIHLELMRDRPRLSSLVGCCMQKMEKVFDEYQPDVVVTQGDTATSAAISLSCFYSRIPVVHVEAGLRTGDIQSPWPEELNRRVATLASDLHCAPTQYAADKLLAEGVAPAHIFISGNPVVDALLWTLEREKDSSPDEHEDHRPRVVLTAHRRENFGKPLESICSAVLELSAKFPDHRFSFVTHPNPNAGPVVRSILDGNSRIEVAPPMSYPEFVKSMKSSRLIISDSGGVQEEAPTLKVPLLITRESTERPEAVHCGAAELVGTDKDLLVSRATDLLTNEASRSKMLAPDNPFGTGNSGQLIINQIVQRYAKR